MWLVFSGVPRVSELPALHLETKESVLHGSDAFTVVIFWSLFSFWQAPYVVSCCTVVSIRSKTVAKSHFLALESFFCCEKLVECLFW
jgi:hypothetical protein